MTKRTKSKKVKKVKKIPGPLKGFTYQGRRVVLAFSRYANGQAIAIRLKTLGGELYATATVNLPNDIPAKDCVFIKDYSENEGMLTWLVENNIVITTGRVVFNKTLPSGFVTIPEARLLEPWLELFKVSEWVVA